VSLLEELGYTRVSHFLGGLKAWREASLPIERGQTARPDAVAHVPARRPRREHDRGGALVDLFERRSTADLIWLWVGTVGACAVVYWLLTRWGIAALREGDRLVTPDAAGLLTSAYFSFVTATSVGFGDVVPMGAARAVAIGEAILGLLVFGAVVSKLVSRRQEEVIREIHRIAFEERLERVQTDLHLVLAELQNIAQLCKAPDAAEEQVRARVESASGICLAELRTIHDLLYRPQAAPEEAVLEGILASLALVLRELRDLMRCLSFRSPYLRRNLEGVAKLANEICADCVPRRYAAHLREWMDAIQTVAGELS
jgi:potassium channel LctB